MMVTLYVAAIKVDAAVNFAMTDPEPGAAKLDGVNVSVSPPGRLPFEKLTDELNPPLTVTLALMLVLAPATSETEDAALTWNAGVGIEPSAQ